MPNELRGRLDRAIDRAVRGMMQVDPRPGLRHRVTDRLEGPSGRRWGTPAFATAAMILLVVSVAVFRQPQAPPDSEPPVTAGAPVAAGVPTPPAGSNRAPKPVAVRPTTVGSERVPPRTTGSIFGSRTGRVSAASLADEVSDVPAEPPETSAPLSGGIAPITITPITVTPIRIQPLTLNPVRDQR